MVEFVKKKGLIIPVLLDRDGNVSRKGYGVYILPAMFLIDRKGIIRNKAIGLFDKKALMDFVSPYLHVFSCSSAGEKLDTAGNWKREGKKCTKEP